MQCHTPGAGYLILSDFYLYHTHTTENVFHLTCRKGSTDGIVMATFTSSVVFRCIFAIISPELNVQAALLGKQTNVTERNAERKAINGRFGNVDNAIAIMAFHSFKELILSANIFITSGIFNCRMNWQGLARNDKKKFFS